MNSANENGSAYCILFFKLPQFLNSFCWSVLVGFGSIPVPVPVRLTKRVRDTIKSLPQFASASNQNNHFEVLMSDDP